MSTLKARLLLGLSIALSSTLATAGVLYFGARSLEHNATRTREANDDVRELLAFALAAHRYMGAFGQSLGQRTLIANNERRVAARGFEQQLAEIPRRRADRASALPWNALSEISGDIASELNHADVLRSEGKFYDAEMVFNHARKTQFERRMLPWFEDAIKAQGAQVDAAESNAVAQARTLRAAGNVLAVLAVTLTGIAVVAMLLAIIRPIRLIVEGADAIAKGDFAHRIPYQGTNELGVLAKRFNDMAGAVESGRAALLEKNSAIEQAYLLQSDFLSIVSHELRSPLNSIIGYTELVIDDCQELSALGKKNVFSIATCARRLLALINDILDFSKLRAGRMQVRQEVFRALELALHVVDEGRALAQGRGVEVHLSADAAATEADAIEMCSDEMKVRQILTNLVSNAVKFSDKGSVVVGVERSGEAEVRFSVTDNGIGIADHQLAVIFEPFRQVHGADQRAVSGTGLGLAIVARLSDLLGGRVSVRSVVGEGSEFSVILPTRAKG